MSSDIELRKVAQELSRNTHVLKSLNGTLLSLVAVLRTIADQRAQVTNIFHGGEIHAEGGTSPVGGGEANEVPGSRESSGSGSTGPEQTREGEATPT